MPSASEAVLAAAGRRAAALVDGDAQALRALHHPQLRWTTFRGDLLGREAYVAGNTSGALRWRRQHLEDAEVVAHESTAVLVAVVVDEVERDGRRERLRLRLTQTWVLDGGSWVVLAAHAGPAV